ncbi:MAG: hypothetical protein WCK75_08555 [Elusimicrobiota bacterium]
MLPENKDTPAKETKTGRYIYDKKLGKVVKVSDDIPGLKKTSPTSAGAGCPMNPGGHNCGGGCGCHG